MPVLLMMSLRLRPLGFTFSPPIPTSLSSCIFFFFQAEDGIRDVAVTGVQTCALPISLAFGAVITGAWVALGLVASFSLFLWAAGSAWQRRLKLVLSPLYIPLAMFVLLGLAQYWARLPLDRFETRQALVLLGADLTFFFLATQLFASADSRTWRLFGPTVLLFAGSLGLFAILQTASGTAQIYGVVETPGNLHFGPYVNPNHYAGLMEMLLPIAVLYIVGRRRRSSVAALLLLVVIATVALTALLLSGSRGGLLALFAETAIVVALLGWGARAAEKRSEEHTSELQSRLHLVCRPLLGKKKSRHHARH